MPGCGETEIPEGVFEKTLGEGGILRSKISAGPYDDTPASVTNKPFVRDMTYDELEELIEKCVRRVIQGEDVKREYEKLRASMEKR